MGIRNTENISSKSDEKPPIKEQQNEFKSKTKKPQPVAFIYLGFSLRNSLKKIRTPL